MADLFAGNSSTVSSPARKHLAIVPSDTVDLTDMPKAIYCQGAGTAMIRDENGVSLPYALLPGQYIPFRGTRIMATGTTGTFYAWY